MMIKRTWIVLILCIVFSSLSAQSVIGKWKTIDDDTGEARSVVEIYEENGKIYGKINEIINPETENPICSKCEGNKENKPIVGLVIIEDLAEDDEVYEDGTILDPENGKVYDCRLKLEEDTDTLQVRGYISFFYKTQYWKRIK